MKKLLFGGAAALALALACSEADAAACGASAFVHPTGGASPWNWSGATTFATTSGGSTACTLSTATSTVIFDAGTTTGVYIIDGATSIFGLTSTGAPAGVILTQNAVTLTVNNGTTSTSFDISHLSYCNQSAGACTGPITSARTIAFTNTGGTTTITTGSSLTTPYNQIGTATFNGTGGTFDLADNAIFIGTPTVTAGTLQASTTNSSPSFQANLTIPSGFTLNCGTGTWNMTGTGSVLTFSSGSTISCGSGSNITFTTAGEGTQRTLSVFNTLVLGNVTISNNGSTLGSIFSMSGLVGGQSAQLTNFTVSNVNAPLWLGFTPNTTWNFSNDPTISGAATNKFVTLAASGTSLVSFGFAAGHAVTSSYNILCNVKASVVGTSLTASNSYDVCGANTGANGTTNRATVTNPVLTGGGVISD